MPYTGRCLKTLQIEADLQEIVKLVGMDALSAEDRLTLDTAQSIREDFLQQNAFLDIDSYSPLQKQFGILDLIFTYEDLAREAITAGADIEEICALLEEREEASLYTILMDSDSRAELVARFMGVLELIKIHRITITTYRVVEDAIEYDKNGLEMSFKLNPDFAPQADSQSEFDTPEANPDDKKENEK
jgi:vacuolar-type H+-ATPase catalytic subunit A/Vma1